MKKLMGLIVCLNVSSCAFSSPSDKLVYDEPLGLDGTGEAASAKVINDSGLADQSVSNRPFKSEELETALRTMLSRLVRSSGDIESGDHVWEQGAYLVKPGDTLSDIVYEAVKGTDIHPDFILAAIVRANPSVFVRGNPNWMLAGKKIKFPQPGDFQRMIFKEKPKGGGSPADSDPYKGWITYP